MGNVAVFDAWLKSQGYSLETFSVFQTSIPQALVSFSNLAAFQQALLDWQSTYSRELVFKRNSGVNQFTYYVLGQNKGICITINDTAQAPGVVMKMGMKEYFEQHTTQRWYFKHGVVLLAGAIVTLGLQAATAGLIDVKYAAVVVTVLNMLNDKLRLINPDAPWVGVGAQKKA